MSTTQPPHEGHAPDSPSDVRALPARPSLEFERKQAKKLVAQLHDSDADALARVRAKLMGSANTKPDEFQLSDAQFTIAREYGFRSWPRLVEYFETLTRHEAAGRHAQAHGREANEKWARGIIAKHRNRRNEAAQVLAAFVPRFYGRSNDEIFAAEVTIEDAYLVQARMNRYPSWEVMLAEDRQPDDWERQSSPLSKAMRAIRAQDADQFADVLRTHPGLLTEKSPGQPGNFVLVQMALMHDLRTQAPGARGIIDWLRERIDLHSTLNWMLLGHWHMPTGTVQMLLDAGADPSWTAPNGYTVIEHAIVRYWNREAVDLIASRVSPPKSFWVAAGLGDVRAVERFLDKQGNPTDLARKNRPDFTALHMGLLPFNPAADDQTIVWEAFLVAALNQRFEVLDVILDRGFPIDYGAWGQPILYLAVGNGWVPLLEYLVRRGANVALAREIAEHAYLNPHGHPDKQRILELCGGRDPEVLIRERDEKQATRVMHTHPSVEEAFVFAKQDAIRQGLTAVAPENVLIAILHQGRLPLAILSAAGVDLERLHEKISDRLNAMGPVPPAEMTSDAEATAILLAARAEAERRKHDALNSLHVFVALLTTARSVVLEMLEPVGATEEKLIVEVDRFLASW